MTNSERKKTENSSHQWRWNNVADGTKPIKRKAVNTGANLSWNAGR